MKSRTITPKVGFKNDKGKITERVCFPMREVSALEESEYWVGLAGLSDKPKDEQAELRYDLQVETLAAWIAEMPYARVENAKPKDEKEEALDADIPFTGKTPADAVREYFKEKTIQKDRALHSILNSYTNEVGADVVF